MELEVVEVERGGGDVDAEECRGVPVHDPDRRIQRQHVRGHPARVAPRLHVEALEHHVLPPHHPIDIKIYI